MSQPKLFTPVKVGDVTLQHRVVMAPLTRDRADKNHVPTPMMAEYYAQRGSTPGTLLISEATFIAPQAGGYPHVPGIWNDAQVAGWQCVRTSHGYRISFVQSYNMHFRLPTRSTLKGHSSTCSCGLLVVRLNRTCLRLREITHTWLRLTFC